MSQSRSLEVTKEAFSEKARRECNMKLVPAGTVLFSFKLSIGKVSIAARDLFTNEAIAALPVLDPSKLDTEYLARALEFLNFSDAGNRAVMGKTLNKAALKQIKIPLPPIAEQRRIAAILDQADALRRLCRQTASNLDALRQAIFHEMFGKAAASGRFPASRLANLAELINGDRSSNYPSGSDIQQSGIPFLSTTNIKNGQLDLRSCNFITESKFSSLSRGKLMRKDIVVTLRGTLGQCALFDCEYETGFINAQMMIIRCSGDIMPRYLLEYLSLPSVQSRLKASNSGTAVPQLTAAQMKELEIIVPEIGSQEAFVKRLDHVDSLSRQCLAQSNEFDTLFASLQHRAFRGEL